MGELAVLLINIAVVALPIVLAMITGTILERRHFESITDRETRFAHMPVLTSREIPDDAPVVESRLLCGSVVVSIDYFKRFLASLRNIFGGEMRAYCSLLDRGRREAVLRMKEQWPEAELIVNLRVETSSISKGGRSGRQQQLGSTEVLAYGTAVRFAPGRRD